MHHACTFFFTRRQPSDITFYVHVYSRRHNRRYFTCVDTNNIMKRRNPNNSNETSIGRISRLTHDTLWRLSKRPFVVTCITVTRYFFHYSVNDMISIFLILANIFFNNYFSVVYDIISRFSQERFIFLCYTLNSVFLCRYII